MRVRMDACRRRKLRRVSAKTEALMSDETKEARKKIALENKARSLPRSARRALARLRACLLDHMRKWVAVSGPTYRGHRRGRALQRECACRCTMR